MNDESSEALTYAEKVALLTRALRNLFGWSQTEVAKAAKLSRPTISRIEKLSNTNVTKSATLEELLHVFESEGVQVSFNTNDVVLTLSNDALKEAKRKILLNEK